MAECGSVTIVDAAPQYELSNCRIEQSEVRPDAEVRATVTVANTGNADGSGTIVWMANGQQVASNTAEIRAGQQADFTGIFVPSDEGIQPGDVSVSVEATQVTKRTTSSGFFG